MLLPQGVFGQQLMSSTHDESQYHDEIYNMDIHELMEIDIRTGKPGWFGTQLEQLEFEHYVHGYVTMDYRSYDLNRGSRIDSFDMHYFNVIVGANIEDTIERKYCWNTNMAEMIWGFATAFSIIR